MYTFYLLQLNWFLYFCSATLFTGFQIITKDFILLFYLSSSFLIVTEAFFVVVVKEQSNNSLALSTSVLSWAGNTPTKSKQKLKVGENILKAILPSKLISDICPLLAFERC